MGDDDSGPIGGSAGSISGVKVSVSLPDDDVAFLDEYAGRAGSASRSAVIHQAIGLLRSVNLEEAYAAAWDEWSASEDGPLWDGTTADGIVDAAR
jgi:Arc/MetJ-type ribon-helix-helix transcriptional regulator